MRTWVAGIAVLLMGCAILVPDYNAKKHIWTPPPPHVSVQLRPFGRVCATDIDESGKWFSPAMVLIHVIGLPPMRATIVLNKGMHRVRYSPGKVFVLRYRAQLGLHRVDTDVGGHKATRVLTVFQCKSTKRGEALVQ